MMQKKEHMSRAELKAYFPEAFKDVSLDKIRPKELKSYIGFKLEEEYYREKEEVRAKKEAVLRMLREEYNIET